MAKKWSLNLILVSLTLLIVFNIMLLTGSFEKASAQSCISLGGLHDPGAHFCVLADRSEGCPAGFSAKTRRHVITTRTGDGQHWIGLHDGFVGPTGAWNLNDNYGWHCGGDYNFCNEDDPGRFHIAEYYCCK